MRLEDVFKINAELQEKIKSFEEKVLTCIRISEYAFKKILSICDNVVKEFGDHFEWMGYLLCDDDYIIRDIYVPYQVIRKSSVAEDERFAHINEKELLQVAQNFNMRVVGWCHSHADFAPFHSGIDDSTTKSLGYMIGRIFGESFLVLDESPIRKYKFYVKEDQIIAEGHLSQIHIKINAPLEFLRFILNRKIIRGIHWKKLIFGLLSLILEQSEFIFYKKMKIFPVYSIVVNDFHEYYCEIWKYRSDSGVSRVSKGYKLLRLIPDRQKMNENEIRTLVRDRIRC